jgi:hypothetical protein
MTITGANTHDPRQAEADSHAGLMNGFVGWLATQPLPAVRRRAYHRAILRFLAWCRLHPGCDDPAWYYRSGLYGSGISDSELDIIREALSLWSAYQRGEQPATPTDHSRARASSGTGKPA